MEYSGRIFDKVAEAIAIPKMQMRYIYITAARDTELRAKTDMVIWFAKTDLERTERA